MKHLTPADKETASHLKASLWSTVVDIVEKEINSLSPSGRLTTTPEFTSALVELIYNQAISLGEDLESFATHAKRKTIQPEDVYMVTRRNDMLTAILEEFAAGLNENNTNTEASKVLPEKKSEASKAPNLLPPEAPQAFHGNSDDFNDEDDDLFANV